MTIKKRVKQIIICLAVVSLLISLLSICVNAQEAGCIENGAVYCLKNVGSGKYLNVHNHVDADGTNVYQWTADGSVEQRFRFQYTETPGWYRIYAMCSSNGTYRCLDIVKSGNSVVNGCNLEIYRPIDTIAQQFIVESAGPQQVYLRSYTNPNVVIGARDNSNGSSTGKSSTSTGNVYMQTYTGSNYQKWVLEPYSPTTPIANGQYYIRSEYSNKYLTVNGINVLQKTLAYTLEQKWNITNIGDGLYLFEPASNLGYRMDVANAYDGNGANVGIHPDNGNAAQRYRIISSGSNSYRIAPTCSATRVLDVCGPSTDENTNIQIWTYENVSQQKWVFERTETTACSRSVLSFPSTTGNYERMVSESNEKFGAMSTSEYLLKATYLAGVTATARTAAQSYAIAYPVAADMLLHFLGFSGSLYTLPANFISSASQTNAKRVEVITALNAAYDALKVPGYTIQYGRKNEISYSDIDDSMTDWRLAVNKCDFWGTLTAYGTGTKQIQVYVRDYYDWSGDMDSIFGVAASALAECHYAGIAREFPVTGSYSCA